MKNEQPLITIIQDDREKIPFDFKKPEYNRLGLKEVKTKRLAVGDYMIEGVNNFSIERKRFSEFFNGCVNGKGAKRIVDEINRAKKQNIQLVVIVDCEEGSGNSDWFMRILSDNTTYYVSSIIRFLFSLQTKYKIPFYFTEYGAELAFMLLSNVHRNGFKLVTGVNHVLHDEVQVYPPGFKIIKAPKGRHSTILYQIINALKYNNCSEKSTDEIVTIVLNNEINRVKEILETISVFKEIKSKKIGNTKYYRILPKKGAKCVKEIKKK